MNAYFNDVNLLMPWFFPAFFFVIGACVGSFLNVVIYRIPAGRSIVRPGSHCACGKPIAWHHNIPVLSWVFLRGRAACCGRCFSVRYPAVELLTGVLFLFAWIQYPPMSALVFMVFIAWMIAPSFIDLDTMEIPDVFSIGGFLLGLFLAFLVPAIHVTPGELWLIDAMRSATLSMKGAFIGSGLILWVALVAELVLRKDAMGFGDVKLMGAIGAFCGWQGAVFSLFGGAVLGCCAMLILLPFGGFRRETPETEPSGQNSSEDEEGDGLRIPFGPALAGGALVYVLIGREWVDQYFQGIADVLFP